MNDALGTTQASASQLTFRQATLNDLPELARVFNEIWPQEEPLKHTPMGLEMAKYLTLGYMSRATFANMAFTADGTFAGTTFARVEGQRLLFPEASDMARETAQFISEDPMGKLAVDFYDGPFHEGEQQMERDSEVERNTQAELLLYMVNPATQGMGVGGKLWKALMHELRKEGVHSFFLHTDTTCDYTYYEYHGLKRVAERLHADHPEDDDQIYRFNYDMFVYRGDVPAAVQETPAK